MIAAWKYDRFLKRQLIAEQTAALLNIQIPKGKPRIQPQDITGVWYDGEPHSKAEVIQRIKNKRKRKA